MAVCPSSQLLSEIPPSTSGVLKIVLTRILQKSGHCEWSSWEAITAEKPAQSEGRGEGKAGRRCLAPHLLKLVQNLRSKLLHSLCYKEWLDLSISYWILETQSPYRKEETEKLLPGKGPISKKAKARVPNVGPWEIFHCVAKRNKDNVARSLIS